MRHNARTAKHKKFGGKPGSTKSGRPSPLEAYKSIESHHNYAVSNLGNVKNNRTGRILKPQSSKRGGYYLFVNLYNKGVRVNKTIHGLVAEAFLGPRPEGHEIHHKDSDHQNNKELNLKYVHAVVHRLIKRRRLTK